MDRLTFPRPLFFNCSLLSNCSKSIGNWKVNKKLSMFTFSINIIEDYYYYQYVSEFDARRQSDIHRSISSILLHGY